MKIWIDPPSGWKFGFPKPLDSEKVENYIDWIVEQGYPRSIIDNLGEHFYVRQWVCDEEDYEEFQTR